MKTSTRFALAILAVCSLFMSACGDDPVTGPGGGFSVVSYRGEIESYQGTFEAVCGSAPDDVYAVGDAVLHFDGLSWKPLELPRWRGSYEAAWSPARGELFLTDDVTLYHYSQGEWSWFDSDEFIREVWATSATNAYALNYYRLFHYNGLAWRDVHLPELHGNMTDIAGNGAGDIVICGERGLILQYDGSAWTATEVDTNLVFTSVARTPSGRTFVSERSGGVYEIAGTTMTPLPDGGFNQYGGPLLYADGDALVAAGWDEPAFRYAIRRYATGEWTPIGETERSIRDIRRIPGGDLFVSGNDGLLWRVAPDGVRDEDPRPRRHAVFDAWGNDDALFLVGHGAYRYSGGGWTDTRKEYITEVPALAVYGRSERDVYAVGESMVLHYDGSEWSWVNGAFGERLTDVWVGPEDDVVALSRYSGGVVEYDGVAWTRRELSPEPRLRAVWGTGDRVFVVGSGGFFAERAKGEWHSSQIPGSPSLYGLWGLDERHIYALTGESRTFYFYDGRRWSPISTDAVYTTQVQALWGTSPSNLFSVDDWGTIAHYDGHAWTEVPRVLGEDLSTIWGLPGGGFAVAGSYGIATYRRR